MLESTEKELMRHYGGESTQVDSWRETTQVDLSGVGGERSLMDVDGDVEVDFVGGDEEEEDYMVNWKLVVVQQVVGSMTLSISLFSKVIKIKVFSISHQFRMKRAI